MTQKVQIHGRRGYPINPGEIEPMAGWPVRHLNAGTAGVKQLLPTPGNDKSYFVTGFILGGGADGDGFHILRRNCLCFTASAQNLSFADHASNNYDWGNKATNGDFRCTFRIKQEATTAAVPLLMKRGNETNNGWLIELTSDSYVKFTAHDGSNGQNLTGTTALDDGEWHQVDCVVDRSSATGMQIYVDGVADATAADPTSITNTIDGGTTIIMTGVDSETFYISTVGFYIGSTTPLTAADILSDYNSGIGRKFSGSETALVAAFNTDEGIGSSCHDILNVVANIGSITGATWAPSKQSGATAAVAVQGVPFEKDTVALDTELLDAMGKFLTCYESANEAAMGLTVPQIVTFPHAIKIGRNNPLSILETDGAFDLMLFGFTDKY